jgi:ribosome-associated protein
MLEITPDVRIDERELEFEFSRAAGPGGQNVNKVATAVQLRFNAGQSSALPAEVRERLSKLAGRRMTRDGILIIVARRFRSQQKNRADAIQRFTRLVRQALERPPSRTTTRPTGASREARLKSKKHRAATKRARGEKTFE